MKMRLHALLVCTAVLLPFGVKAHQSREISPYIDLVFCPAKEQPWSCARQQSGRIMDLWNDQLDAEWQKLKVEADQQLNTTLEQRGYSSLEPLTKEKPSTILKKIEIGTKYMKDYLSETFDGFLGREYGYGYGAVQEQEQESPSDAFDDVEGEGKKGSKKKKKMKKKKKKKKRKKRKKRKKKKGESEHEYEYQGNQGHRHKKKGHQQQEHVTSPTILFVQPPTVSGHTSGFNVHDFHQQQEHWHEKPKPQQVFLLQEHEEDEHKEGGGHGGGHGGGGHGGKKKRKRKKKKKHQQSTFTAIPALLGSKPKPSVGSLLLHEPEEYDHDYEHESSALSILGSLVGDYLEDDDEDEHGYVVVKQKRKKMKKRKKKKHKKPIKYGRDLGVTRGKKKKKKKFVMKLVLLGTFLKAKIELLLKILGAHLQVKFFAIALVGLLINIVRFWIDLKRGGAPQKVVYVEHAHHQHHYEDHGDEYGDQGAGGYWKRSIETDPMLEQTSENMGTYHVPAYDPHYMAYKSQLL